MFPSTRFVSALLVVVGHLVVGCHASYPDAVEPALGVPATPDGFVEAVDVAPFIGHDGVSFVDARPLRTYMLGHAPGAVAIDWRDFVDQGQAGLSGRLDADLGQLARVLGDRGVLGDDWIIIFGDPLNGWGEDGRVAWTLRTLGVERLSVVNGGYPAWQAAELPVQRGRLRRSPVSWSPQLQDQYLARKPEVIDFVDRHGVWDHVLVDVRSNEEFRGVPDAPQHGVVRPGHIPTAVNLPWRELLDDSGRVLLREQLEGVLISRGIRPDAHIVTYCTGGVRSAHTWWVLHWLGYPSVKSYPGSLWEWSLDRRLPVEKGGHRPREPGPPWPPVSSDPIP